MHPQANLDSVFDMMDQWFNVNITQKFQKGDVPLPLLVVPHFGEDYENAAWMNWYFMCGDGNSTFYPLCTAADVLAHELGEVAFKYKMQ